MDEIITTLATLTADPLKTETMEKNIRTRVFQVQVRHKNFPELLNAAVIIKTNLKTGRAAKGLLFSKETQVNNAAHFSLFMVTFSRLLSAKIEGVNRGSMPDLKTVFRGCIEGMS